MNVIRGHLVDYANRFEFVVGIVDLDGEFSSVAEPVTLMLRTVVRSEEIRPTFSLSRDEARTLFNEMWQAGMRPANYVEPGPTIGAMKEHIADLRKLLEWLRERK